MKLANTQLARVTFHSSIRGFEICWIPRLADRRQQLSCFGGLVNFPCRFFHAVMFHPDRILEAAEQQIASTEYQTAKLEPPPSSYVVLVPLNSDWNDKSQRTIAPYAPSYTVSEASSSMRPPSEPSNRASVSISTVKDGSVRQHAAGGQDRPIQPQQR